MNRKCRLSAFHKSQAWAAGKGDGEGWMVGGGGEGRGEGGRERGEEGEGGGGGGGGESVEVIFQENTRAQQWCEGLQGSKSGSVQCLRGPSADHTGGINPTPDLATLLQNYTHQKKEPFLHRLNNNVMLECQQRCDAGRSRGYRFCEPLSLPRL